MEDLKDTDMLTLAIKEMSKSFPTLWRTLVLERDQ
jgi:pheromone shutdown protein TraB